MDQRPIGIFDSGLGGLTAAKALEEILPEENLIYFGDTRNAPYGVRSREDLTRLATANAAFLTGFGCKAILVACGTVSSNVMDVLEQRFDTPFFGVIEAPCRRAAALAPRGRIGVIATEATIRSGAFERRLRALAPAAEVFSAPCQSLVTLAEQGHFRSGDPAAEQAVAQELRKVKDWGPDVLLLACTHFPLFSEQITAFLGGNTVLLSVGAEAAAALKGHLEEKNRLAGGKAGTRRWFTSGDAELFARQGGILLGHSITAQQHINGEGEAV